VGQITSKRDTEGSMRVKCIDCRYFDNRSEMIERTFPGLNSLSSAYSSVWAESGFAAAMNCFSLHGEGVRISRNALSALLIHNNSQ